MDIRVEKYVPCLGKTWQGLIDKAKNGLFLFERPYIEYHRSRFADASVVVFLGTDARAIMPAAWASDDRTVISHPGLTFGGPILDRKLRSSEAMAIIDALLAHYRVAGASTLRIKAIPETFCTYPSGEIGYALWRRKFCVVRRDLSSVLPLTNSIPFNTLKKRSLKRAAAHGLKLATPTVMEFHNLLREVLLEQHNVTPTHSIRELKLLCDRFPKQILLRGAYNQDQLLAVTAVYNYGRTWHTQYLASSGEGRRLGALDLIVSNVIGEAEAAGATYLSFGTSTTEEGLNVNEGLLWQKESFGARAITHDVYEGTP